MAPIFLPLNYTILERYKRKMRMKYKHDSLSWSIHMDTLECCKGIALHLPKRVNRSCSRPQAGGLCFQGLQGSINLDTVKPVLSSHSQKDQKWVFKTNYCLMQVKSIAECSKGNILQYFRPALSFHMALRPLFCLF